MPLVRKDLLGHCCRRLSAAAAGGLSLVAIAVVAVSPRGAAGAVVSVTGTVIGSTPTYIGYNSGNYFSGSNTTAWVDYSGANAFRIFASAGSFEPTETGLQTGTGISTLADFDARKAALRASPLSTTYTNWSAYNSEFANLTVPGSNALQLNYALGELTSHGVAPILEMTRTPASFTTWGDQYDEWHFYYAMAYHAAQAYGVSQFQMFNEPDHTDANGDPAMNATEWLQCMKLASDAVKSAVQDVDAAYGKTLVANLSGPTTNGASGYAAYGQPAISTNYTDYAGRAVTSPVLGTFDMHRYGTSAASFVSDVTTVRADMIADGPTHAALPITYTEFNSRTTASYAGSTDTADTPAMFTGVATDVLAAMSVGANGMYAFKFNQTPDPTVGGGAVQKTGFYYTDNANAPYNTTGATLGGEVMRLVGRAFEDARPTYATTGTVAGYTTATSYDPASKNYYLMGVNQNAATSASYTLSLSPWSIPAGSVVSVEEVSGQRHGEVTQLITVPANGQIAVNQPANSVWLLTVPSGPQRMTTLAPTQDAQVRNGTSAGGTDYRTQTDPSDPYARVGRSDTDQTGDFVSYMKFDLGTLQPASVQRAIFQVYGQVLSGPPITFHVYALTGTANNWDASTLDWDNAPGLAGASDALLTGVGTTAFPVGSLTYTAGGGVSGLDLTPFLTEHLESELTLVMVREQQFAGDVDTSYVRLDTSESATPPALLLFTAAPEPGPATLLAAPALALLARRRRRIAAGR